MKLEPHEGRRKGATVHDTALVPGRRVRIAQMPLQHEDLPQELDVPAGERQNTEARAEVFRAAVMLIEQAERNEQRAEQNGISKRFGIPLERTAIVVDRA